MLRTFSQTPIQDIQVGDEVLTRDQNDPNAPLQEEQVTQVIQHTVYALSDVTILDADGQTEVIRATPEHPFYVDGLGWTGASQLTAGEQLEQPDGSLATVVSVTGESDPQGVAVYNFTVAEDHTYFVDQGGDAVWVHNNCVPDVVNERYVNNNPKATPSEQNVGKLLDNEANSGNLRDVARVEGNVESPPGQASNPDYKLYMKDGSTAYGDLYQPQAGTPIDNIAYNAMYKGGQTAGGVVIVQVPNGVDATVLESALRVMIDTPGATKLGTQFFLLNGTTLSTPLIAANP